jgi:hypothetical protein
MTYSFTFAQKILLMNKYSITLFLIFISLVCRSQTFFPAKKYPSNSYRNPMDFPISLAGNFGECRANHFHSGIDIRTNKVENQPVHCIQDGFVSRVKIEATGFGNAIYITHADGHTSLYAHLNKFYPELQNQILRTQYKTKSWKQDLYFMPHEFPLRKGAFIAWSGNTGSSEAPHLHMEIRNAKSENPLNPLLFYAGLTDTKAPVVKQIAIYDGTKSIYEQKPNLVSISKKGAKYEPAKPLLEIQSSKVYFGINGDDYMENALGTLGIYEMRMYVNDKPYFAWQLDNISYDVTRYMNSMADYKTKKNGGLWIQLCHKLPNDKLKIYKSFANSDGIVDLSDGEVKMIRIQVLDTKNNSSSVEFSIQGKNISNKITCLNEFIQGKKSQFKNEHIELTLTEDCLYDNICFKTSIKPNTSTYSHIYQVHYPYVPLHSYFDLKLRPKMEIPKELKDKIAVVRFPSAKETKKKGKAASLSDGLVIANVREFGDYEITVDQKAPSINTLIKNNSVVSNLTRLSFVVKDETTSIKTCLADLDGDWLRIVQKGDNFYYEMDEHFPKGTHLLTLTASDENGNTNKVSYTLTR